MFSLNISDCTCASFFATHLHLSSSSPITYVLRSWQEVRFGYVALTCSVRLCCRPEEMWSSVLLAWRVRNMSSTCQGTEAATVARLFHCNRLLPRKRSGLAITTEKEGRDKNGQKAHEILHAKESEWLKGRRGDAENEEGEFHSSWQREPLLSERKLSAAFLLISAETDWTTVTLWGKKRDVWSLTLQLCFLNCSFLAILEMLPWNR